MSKVPATIAVRLSDGTPAVTRRIRAEDGVALVAGLRRLSPAGHAYRFLHYRSGFSEAELAYLTGCDFVDHFGLILAILDRDGKEIDRVGVARCIRSPEEPDLAEVAVVLVDEWQRHGGGSALLRHLAALAAAAGIRRWQAFSLDDNLAAPRLLARFGAPVSRRAIGHGATETIYRLHAPAGNPGSG